MTKKKLLLIAPSLKQGGFQRVCARTALLLQERFEVMIVIFDGKDKAYSVEDIPVYDIKVKAQKGVWNKLINVCRRVQRVRRLKKELGVDISYSFGMSANLINVLTRVKDVIWCGVRSYIDLETTTLGFVSKKSDCVIACSKMLEQHIKRRYPFANTVTIYNPFDMEKLIEESKADIDEIDRTFMESDGKIIAAMGREDVLKGYWHLLKAFALLKTRDVRLCIIGNGEFSNEKRLVKDLKLEERVYFTGGKTNPFAYVKHADVFVMSSVHEGFPNALVEAMALGLPVISTNCETGPLEILSDDYTKWKHTQETYNAEYGVLVPEMTEQPNYDFAVVEAEETKLAEAMDDLLCNELLCKKYSIKSRERAKTFNAENYVNAFVELAQMRL